jgi:hypothetical protein
MPSHSLYILSILSFEYISGIPFSDCYYLNGDINMYSIYNIYTIIFISCCACIHSRIRHIVFINTYLWYVLIILVCILHHYNTEKVFSSALAWLRLVLVVFGYAIHFPRTDKCSIIPIYQDSNPLTPPGDQVVLISPFICSTSPRVVYP